MINPQKLIDFENKFCDKKKKKINKKKILNICFIFFYLFLKRKIELNVFNFTVLIIFIYSDIIYLIILLYFSLLDK